MTREESSADLRQTVARRLSESTATLPMSALTRLQHASDIATQGGFRRFVRLFPGEAAAREDRRAAERIALALGRLRGVPMKLGQLAGYFDSSIPEHLRPAFAALQTQAPAMSIRQVKSILAGELGSRAERLTASIDDRPFAAGAIGQVHRAMLDGAPVAVKVRYPGIERAIRVDFRPAAFGTRALMGFSGRRGGTVVREVMARLLEESAYASEAARQASFARRFASHPVIGVPAVHAEYSSDAVLTTDLVDGLHLHDYLATDPSAEARRRAGIALFEFYVAPLFMAGEYNSDPHPGNYLFSADGRITVVDHGSGRSFGDGAVDAIRGLARSALADEQRGATEALRALGLFSADRRADERTARQVLAWLFAPVRSSEETVWTLPKADEVKRVAKIVRDLDGLTHPGEVVFFIRLRVALSAALAKLRARANWREAFEAHLEGRFFLRPPTYDVVLVTPGPRTIELLRVLRDELGGAVTQAKALIDAAPCVIRSGVDRKTAEAFGDRLGHAGAKVELQPRKATP